MRENKLSVLINKPVGEVFAFTVNPKNTPLWVDSIIEEKTSWWPIAIGSVYENRSKGGKWSAYTVVGFKENRLLELVSGDKNYHVKYTYKAIGNQASELEYYEWVDEGELDRPFTLRVLEKLKSLLEN